MKKRNVLALALAAGLVLGGANTADAAATDAGRNEARQSLSYETYEEAEAAAKKNLETDNVNNTYEISQGLDGKYVFVLKANISENEENNAVANDRANERDAGFDTEAEAAAAAEEALDEDEVNNAYDVVQTASGKYTYLLKYEEKPEEEQETPEKPEEKPEEDQGPKVTIDEWLLKEAKKEAKKELKEAGITGKIYFDQIDKAKTVEGVETLKNEILKAHKGSEEKPGEDDKKPGKDDDDKKIVIPGYKIEDIAKPSKKDKEDGTYKPGYATREEAEKAAKEALKNIKTKDSYTIFEDADGRFGYYLWSKADEEEAEKAAKIKEASKENEKANQKASTPAAKSSNPNAAPKTGVAGMSAVAGLAAVSVAGIIATRKKED